MDEKTDVFLRIREDYDKFSRQHKVIADFILGRGLEVSFLSAKQIADDVGASKATVVRFTQSLGYASFLDFIEELQQTLLRGYRPMNKLKEALFADKSKIVTLESTCGHDIENIRNLITLQQEEEFAKAVKLLSGARRIFLFGARSAYSLVFYGGFLLRELVNNVQYFPSGSEAAYEYLEDVSEDDTIISICFHRYAKSTVKLTKYASERGARIIALTDEANSPIARYSRVVLSAKNNAPFYSYAAAMTLINGILWGFARTKQDIVMESFEKRQMMLLNTDIFI